MRYVTVQEIIGPDPEPMYVVQVKVPMRAGEAVVDELTAVVGQAVYDFEQTVPDRTRHSGVTGYFPPGYGRDDTEE